MRNLCVNQYHATQMSVNSPKSGTSEKKKMLHTLFVLAKLLMQSRHKLTKLMKFSDRNKFSLCFTCSTCTFTTVSNFMAFTIKLFAWFGIPSERKVVGMVRMIMRAWIASFHLSSSLGIHGQRMRRLKLTYIITRWYRIRGW